MTKTNKTNKTEKITDFFKTVLIYVLTISMMCVAGMYINERQNYGHEEEIPLEKRRIIESGGFFTAVKIDENQVKPVQITVTLENNSITSIYNDRLISIVYEDLKDNISGLLKRSECKRLEKTEGEQVWNKFAEKENSIYIRYAGNYIYPVLCAFIDGAEFNPNIGDSGEPSDSSDSSVSAINELAEIHELFIADEDPVYGAAKDADGNVAVFMPNEFLKNIILTQLISTDSLQSAYNNSAGGIPCKFLKGDDITTETGINRNTIENLLFPEDFHIFYDYSIYNTSSVLNYFNPLLENNYNNYIDDIGNINSANGSNRAIESDINNIDDMNSIKKINTEKAYIKDLFKILNFNAETAQTHSDKYSLTYVDGQSTMKFNADGRITYSYEPSDILNIINKTGVHLSRFLGYDAGSYTFYEKLRAASAFVNGLNKELAGGPETNMNLYLKSIKVGENQNLNITYSYYYNGTEIKINGYDYGVFISINEDEDIIGEVIINSVYAVSQEKIKNINPMLILNGLDGMISNDLNELNELKYINELTDDSPDSSDLSVSTESTESTNLTDKEKIAGKYKIKYDKNQDKFIVSKIELMYNINYSDISGGTGIGSAQAEWIIK